jgi:hypothetical protein
MKKLFKRVRPEDRSTDSRSVPESRGDGGPTIVTMGGINELTQGNGGRKTDDPNKWSEKD